MAADPAAAFEAERPRLLRVAYGILGSLAEAEEAVQEAWLRLQRTGAEEIENLPAWLTTVVGRIALDALGSARRRRETYFGTWLPEPLVSEAPPEAGVDEGVTMALMLVLERLSPAERTAFLLHDVFDLPFDAVAEAVGRSPAAVRQLASRARRRVEAGRPRFPASAEEQERVVQAFALAWQAGDLEGLVALLDPDAVLRADGGGKVPSAGKPLHGAERVARALASLQRVHSRTGLEVRGGAATVNGTLGLVVDDSRALSVVSLTVDGGRIVALDIVRNPDKLRHVAVPQA